MIRYKPSSSPRGVRIKHPSKHFNNFDSDLTIEVGYYDNELHIMQKIKKGDNTSYFRHDFKVLKADIEKVKITLKKIRLKFRYHHEWVNFRTDVLKSIRKEVAKEWEEVLPDKVVLWAQRRLKQLSENKSCCDNFRVAKNGNTCQERRYRRQYNKGCCGFMDVMDICPHDGKAYKLGFNYGH